jgi:pilus assembly protein CpaE
MEKLRIVAVTSSEETRSALQKQLSETEYVQFDGVCIELSEAVIQCQKRTPDIIIVELTGREVDAGLFMQAINMNIENPSIIIALHRKLEPELAFEAVRQGARDIVQFPDEAEKLTAALKKYLIILKRATQTSAVQEQAKTGKILSLFSSKGGAGTSTIAVNLAYELHQAIKEPVILLDMDLCFNNTAVILNIKPSYALGDLAQSKASDIDEGLIRKIIVQHESGLELLVGSKSVMDDNDVISIDLLERVMSYLVENYAYVIVDLPSRILDHYHEFMVQRSDMLILVSGLDVPCLYRTRQYLDLAKQFFDESKIKLVLNRCNLKAAFGMSNKNLEEEFHYPIFARLNNDWELNVNANSLGCVLSKVNPSAELVKDFRKLSTLITGTEVEPEPAKKDGNGLFGKLFVGLNTPKRGDERNAFSKT